MSKRSLKLNAFDRKYSLEIEGETFVKKTQVSAPIIKECEEHKLPIPILKSQFIVIGNLKRQDSSMIYLQLVMYNYAC